MAYSDKRRVISFTFNTADAAAAPSDNQDLHHIIIPANKEVEIFALRAYCANASDGADFIELVQEDNTVIAKVSLQNTGQVSAVQSDGSTAATFPQRIAPQSTTLPKLLKLRTDGALDATTFATIEVVMSDPGI